MAIVRTKQRGPDGKFIDIRQKRFPVEQIVVAGGVEQVEVPGGAEQEAIPKQRQVWIPSFMFP